MKNKSLILLSFILFLIAFNGSSHVIIEKNFFDSNKELGGDVIIQKSTMTVEDGKSYKIFEIESVENGNYYMSTWIAGTELENIGSGNYLQYEVFVNNEKQKNKLKPNKNSWGSVDFKDKKNAHKSVKLKKGLNQIAFVCNAPAIPDIDFVRLSKNKDKIKISDEKFKKFKEDIKKEIAEREENPIPETDSVIGNQKSGIVLSNPGGNYYNHMGISFRYTTLKSHYFTSGQQVFFSTYAADGYRHVLEVFKYSNPESYSWVNLSNSSTGLASININIPSSGFYYVRVRAYYQESQGLVDLNINGQYYYSDCAVSGSGFAHYHETPTTYNYFTCYLTGDSRIWIEDGSRVAG